MTPGKGKLGNKPLGTHLTTEEYKQRCIEQRGRHYRGMHQKNLQTILLALKEKGPLAPSELCAILQRSQPVVSNCIRELATMQKIRPHFDIVQNRRKWELLDSEGKPELYGFQLEIRQLRDDLLEILGDLEKRIKKIEDSI